MIVMPISIRWKWFWVKIPVFDLLFLNEKLGIQWQVRKKYSQKNIFLRTCKKRFNILKSGGYDLNVLNFKRFQKEKNKKLQWIRLLYEVAYIFLFFLTTYILFVTSIYQTTIFFQKFYSVWADEKNILQRMKSQRNERL